MPIAESDISILIPTYRYRDKVVRAVQSALDSGAGEIIVTDDRSGDGTIERLAEFTDPRLTVIENERNLGLWENHLQALSLATRPWIKFIQADDYLLPGGLAAYAAAVSEGVSVVFASPMVKDDTTGEVWYTYEVRTPRRVTPAELQEAMLYSGWMLGSPSHVMLRADVIERTPEVWRTTISADLVVGAIAAARGDTVIIPSGAIGQGAHALQDTNTQKAAMGLERAVTSLAYLRRRPEPGLRRLANRWTWLTLKALLRTTARGILYREGSPLTLAAYPLRLLGDLSVADWRQVYRDRARLREAASFRRNVKPPLDVDQLVDRPVPAEMERVAT